MVAPQQTRKPARDVRLDAAPVAGAPKLSQKLSYRETQELAGLPERIAQLELEQTRLAARLADPALYQAGADEARRVQEQAQALESELEAAMQRWEELETRAAR